MPVAILPMAIVVQAFAGLVILYAVTALFKPLLQAMVIHIPLIGSSLSRVIGVMLTDIGSLGRPFAEQSVSAAIAPVIGPLFWLEHVNAGLLNGLDDLQYQTRFVAGPLLNQLFALSLRASEGYTQSEFKSAEAYTGKVYGELSKQILGVYAALVASDAALEAEIATVATEETVFIEAEIAGITAFIEAEMAGVTAFIEAEIAASDAALVAAQSAESAFIEAEVVAIEGDVLASQTAITTWVTSLITGLGASIAAVQSTLTAYIQAEVGMVQTELTTLEATCVDELCEGGSDLARLLKGLMAQGWIAALLGYAAWAATDPEGCGHDTADVLAPIAGGAADTVTSVADAL